MSKAKRRLKKVDISFISLCPRGANQMPVIYKEDGSFEIQSLVKATEAFEEKGELLNVVYVPEVADAQGDIASAEVIKEAAYSYMLNGAGIDIRHDTKALSKEDAYVAESFIIQSGDERFNDLKDLNGSPVDVVGAWATVIKINNPDLRKKYSEGEWNGVSMYGKAAVESLEKEDEKTDIVKSFLKLLGIEDLLSKAKSKDTNQKQEEIDMDAKELAELMKANNEALLEKISGLLPKSKKVEKTDDDEGIKFEGDPTDKVAVAKHLKKLEATKKAAEVDWSDSESVAKYMESLEDAKGKTASQQPAPSNQGSVKKADLKSGATLEKEDIDSEVERILKENPTGYEA